MENELYRRFLLSIVPLVIVNSFFVISVILFFFLYKAGKIEHDEEVLHRGETPLLGMWIRQWWMWMIRPLINFFTKRKIHPNLITGASVFIATLAGLAFSYGEIALGGWLTLIYGTFDLIDGRVARVTGQVTQSGAFLDSTLDRYSEIITYIGILMYYRTSPVMTFIVALAIMGSVMVSYARARGEALGIELKKGVMQRPERIVYLGICGALSPLLTYGVSFYVKNPPEYLFIFALVLIAVFSNITAVQRLVEGYRKLKSGS